jgi:GTP-binding protein
MKQVAIIGRPNVGKSTLFNRLARGRKAIVSDVAGTTRDMREEAVTEVGGAGFVLMDTAGLDRTRGDSVAARTTELSLKAAAKADLILFVVDARGPACAEDFRFADMIRKQGKRAILVANKAENRDLFNANMGDMMSLGFGDPIAVSAEHNQGIGALREAVRHALGAQAESGGANLSRDDAAHIIMLEEEALIEPEDMSVRIAVVGRPNAGKSTLVNALLGEERMLAGPEAGLTRDAIDTDLEYKGRDVKLVDTAGLRKKNKIGEELERMSAARAIEAVKTRTSRSWWSTQRLDSTGRIWQSQRSRPTRARA